MTEIPERPNDPAPVAEDIPRRPRAGWHWPASRRNRIAAFVGLAAAAVAVVAAIFTGGVVAGVHTGNGEPHNPWSHRSAVSAQRDDTPTEQIWIIPAGAAAAAPDGYIVTGSMVGSTNPD